MGFAWNWLLPAALLNLLILIRDRSRKAPY
jgi:hypothetical protein